MTDLTISFRRLTSFVKFYISDIFWHFCTKLQKESKKETAFGGPFSGTVLSTWCLLSPDVVFNIPSVILDIFYRIKNEQNEALSLFFFKLISFKPDAYIHVSIQFQTTYSKNKKEKNWRNTVADDVRRADDRTTDTSSKIVF